jgi:hypothetical protein
LLKGLEADLKSNTADRVAGRVRTKEPVKTRSGDVYALDVVFTTAVTKPPSGKPLDASGGEPGKALEALDAAITKKDWPAIRAALAKATLARFEADYRSAEENLEYAVDILRNWLPKQKLRVVGGELRGETAILDVEGETWPGRSSLYVARMVREDGAWRFENGILAGLLPSQPKKTDERAKNQ